MMKLAIVFLLTLSTLGAGVKVIKVKGKVSALYPHTLKAVYLKKGDVLPEDTSILTKSRSFVKLKYEDGSTVSLGPKSKIVIAKSITKKKAGVLSLLTGQIRAKVKKEKTADNKLILKTRTAALGVRGTDFLVVFNEENNAVSLVTFEGEVAVVKVVESKAEIERLNQMLKESKVAAKAGQFVGMNNESKDLKPAQEIDNGQLKALDQSTDSEVSELAQRKEMKKGLLKAVKPIADLSTGQLVSPKKGRVDRITGFFVAPKGVKLTTKGFVSKDKENNSKILLADSLNGVLKKDPVLYELFVGTSLYTYRSEAKRISDGTQAAFSDDGTMRVELKYKRRQKLHTDYAKLSVFTLKPESRGCQFCEGQKIVTHDGQTFFDLAYGHEYNYSLRWKFGGELSYFNRPVIRQDFGGIRIEELNIFALSGFVRFNIFSSYDNNYYIKQNVDLIYSSRLEGMGIGYRTFLGVERKFSKSLNLAISFFRGEDNYEDKYFDYSNILGGVEVDLNYKM
jgi:hypothetical protein